MQVSCHDEVQDPLSLVAQCFIATRKSRASASRMDMALLCLGVSAFQRQQFGIVLQILQAVVRHSDYCNENAVSSEVECRGGCSRQREISKPQATTKFVYNVFKLSVFAAFSSQRIIINTGITLVIKNPIDDHHGQRSRSHTWFGCFYLGRMALRRLKLRAARPICTIALLYIVVAGS